MFRYRFPGNGGSFATGFASGAFGSVFSHVGGEWAQGLIGHLVGGALGGAFGAAITEQNVLEGAARGLVIAAVNDAMHSTFNNPQKQPDPPTSPGLTMEHMYNALETMPQGYESSWTDYIPIWGSGRDAYRSFNDGNILTGLGHTALAVSDVFLVKAIFFNGGKILLKGGVKMSGSHTWGATKSHWRRRGISQLTGGSKHPALVELCSTRTIKTERLQENCVFGS